MKGYWNRRNNVPSRAPEKPERLARFQVLVGVVVSAATVFIGWQTFQLTERTQESADKLKAIEQQLAENKFGFERVRDIYDRTEKYLSSPTQDSPRGRVLVVLINSLPEAALRSELLAVVAEQAKLDAVAAKAASIVALAKVGPITASAAPPSAGFSGNLALAINEENYTATNLGDFQFIDRSGTVWNVPRATAISGAAIPRMAWSVVGPPLTSDYTIPAVLLEYFATTREQSPDKIYQMFFEAHLATGMAEAKAKILYSAVVQFGPRWKMKP